jgi:hypothetical protein
MRAVSLFGTMGSMVVRRSAPSDSRCRECGQARLLDDASDFPAVLRRLLGTYKVAARETERITGLDHAYVSRLTRGIKGRPGRDVVFQLVLALARHGLEFDEAHELVEAAGYRSPYSRRYRDDPPDEDARPDDATPGGAAMPPG